MDTARLTYDLVRAYVYVLVTASVGTMVWFASPQLAETPRVASLWFAVGAFGALVLVTFALLQYARET